MTLTPFLLKIEGHIYIKAKNPIILLLFGLLIYPLLNGCTEEGPKTLTGFCGAASKPAMEEAAKVFEGATGIRVYLNFGGSGTVLSQMKMSKSGDLYIPGSPDYMVKAGKDGVIDPDTVKIISYLVPAILVQEGNPKNIQKLSDLTRPGIRVGTGDPESVCVGLYAYEILGYNDLIDDVREAGTIVTYAESCSKTASLVALKAVDAILGWRVFSLWHPDTTDVVYLNPEQLPRLSYIPGAISIFTHDRNSAQRFLNFLTSPEGQEIFIKWGYVATESEAKNFAPHAEIGKEYKLPETYKPLVK
ncbi:MAG: molybdate ABC transporter substrate-binding protein [Deltaproteobacteria bacterium]|nr:MAG: molybdate ABC transporter substrate-binding protein [Deltaproteobacteria bacterium]